MITVILFIMRMGNKDNHDYDSIIQIILQMQGGGSAFLVMFFVCISSSTLQTLALVQGKTLLAAALATLRTG